MNPLARAVRRRHLLGNRHAGPGSELFSTVRRLVGLGIVLTKAAPAGQLPGDRRAGRQPHLHPGQLQVGSSSRSPPTSPTTRPPAATAAPIPATTSGRRISRQAQGRHGRLHHHLAEAGQRGDTRARMTIVNSGHGTCSHRHRQCQANGSLTSARPTSLADARSDRGLLAGSCEHPVQVPARGRQSRGRKGLRGRARSDGPPNPRRGSSRG